MTFDLPETEEVTNIMRILLSRPSKSLYVLYQADIGQHYLTIKDIRSRHTRDLDLNEKLRAYLQAASPAARVGELRQLLGDRGTPG